LRLSRWTCHDIVVINSHSQVLASHFTLNPTTQSDRHHFALSGHCDLIVILRHHSCSLRHLCRLLIYTSVPSMQLSPNNVGRTSFLHYYYLAFIVLTYLAYLIAVNTSYISSLGTIDPDIQALIALDWLFGESEKHSLSPSIHHQDHFSFNRITIDLMSHLDTHKVHLIISGIHSDPGS
jgi:hypothetical protein